MPRFFDPLLKLLLHSTERDLLAQIQYLKAENRVLRDKLPKVVKLSMVERSRLLYFGCVLRWSVLCQLITIVSPRTFEGGLSRPGNAHGATENASRRSDVPPHPSIFGSL